MNTQVAQIPDEIAIIIQKKQTEMEEERKKKEESNRQQETEWQMAGEIAYQEYLEQALLKVPDWFYPYLKSDPELDFVRIGRNWDRPNSKDLRFEVPGLSTIQFRPEKSLWRCAYSRWNEYDNDDAPSFSFHDASWYENLESVLCQAKIEYTEYEAKILRYQKQQEDIKAERTNEVSEYEAQQNRNAEKNQQQKLREAKEKAEEQALFDVLKNDPIALHFLKAFVLLRDERSSFEQRLYEADEAMYSIENSWSHKVESLRNEANRIERRARDEQYRLQSDLDDAEAKLKKVQRGW